MLGPSPQNTCQQSTWRERGAGWWAEQAGGKLCQPFTSLSLGFLVGMLNGILAGGGNIKHI